MTPKIRATIFGSQEAAAAAISKRRANRTENVPSDGSVQVRFLSESDAWAGYYETYDPMTRSYRPTVEGEELPEGQRATFRFLAPVLLRDGERSGNVVAMKMPRTLAESVMRKGDKYGTITDRDYVLSRFGKNLDTKYEVDAEPPSAVNIGKYDLPDLLAILVDEYTAAMGRQPVVTDDDEDDDTASPTSVTDDSDVDDDEAVDDDTDEEFDDDDTPDDDSDEDADDESDEDEDADESEDEDEEVELSYEALEAMSLTELRAWAKEYDLTVAPGTKKADLVDLVWEAI